MANILIVGKCTNYEIYHLDLFKENNSVIKYICWFCNITAFSSRAFLLPLRNPVPIKQEVPLFYLIYTIDLKNAFVNTSFPFHSLTSVQVLLDDLVCLF